MSIKSKFELVGKLGGGIKKAFQKDGKISDIGAELKGKDVAKIGGTVLSGFTGPAAPLVSEVLDHVIDFTYDKIMTNEEDKVDDKSFKEYSNKLFSSNNDLKDISQSFNKALGNDLLSDEIKGDVKTQFIANSLKYLENANVDDKTKNGILNGLKNITNETGQKQDDAILKTAALLVNNQIANDPNTKNLPTKELEQLKEKSIKDMTQNVLNKNEEISKNQKNEKEESELDKLNKMANLTNSNPVEIIMDVLKKQIQKIFEAYNSKDNNTEEKNTTTNPKAPTNFVSPSN